MIRQDRAIAALSVLLAAGTLAGQDVTKELVVRTFMLQNMSPQDAAKLITPYVDFTPFGGVFLAGDAVRGITVRGLPAVLARADSLLKANDKPAVTIRFTFQLIVALDSAVQDPAIAAVDGELRQLFKFRGYRLLSQGVIMSSLQHQTTLTLASGRTEFDQYRVDPWIERIEMAPGRGSVSAQIRLAGPPWQRMGSGETIGATILQSSLSMPLGQTIVLGSGSAMGGRTTGSALILTVRPEIVPKP